MSSPVGSVAVRAVSGWPVVSGGLDGRCPHIAVVREVFLSWCQPVEDRFGGGCCRHFGSELPGRCPVGRFGEHGACRFADRLDVRRAGGAASPVGFGCPGDERASAGSGYDTSVGFLVGEGRDDDHRHPGGDSPPHGARPAVADNYRGLAQYPRLVDPLLDVNVRRLRADRSRFEVAAGR